MEGRNEQNGNVLVQFLCWKTSTLPYREEMVKSTQCVFSTVPQLQTEEKYFSTFSQFRWPIHHGCLNTFKNRSYGSSSVSQATLTCLAGVKQACTFSFIVQVGAADAGQARSQSRLPNPAAAAHEHLVADCVHG